MVLDFIKVVFECEEENMEASIYGVGANVILALFFSCCVHVSDAVYYVLACLVHVKDGRCSVKTDGMELVRLVHGYIRELFKVLLLQGFFNLTDVLVW